MGRACHRLYGLPDPIGFRAGGWRQRAIGGFGLGGCAPAASNAGNQGWNRIGIRTVLSRSGNLFDFDIVRVPQDLGQIVIWSACRAKFRANRRNWISV